MEDNVLTSTKKVLGLSDTVVVFDEDVLIHINSAFSHLYQLGIGTAAPIDESSVWSSFGFPPEVLNMVKTFIFLKVKFGFDPPSTSYLVEATEKQIREHEWRLCSFMEETYG